MSDRDAPRLNRMVKVSDIVHPVQDRMERLKAERETERLTRIEEGHRRWGWPLDAVCANCGDTGRWPESIHYCGCRTGMEKELTVKQAANQAARDQVWASVGLPRRFRDWSLSSHPNEAGTQEVRRWVDRCDGSNLYLSGLVGTGKTGLAIGALRGLWEDGASSLRFRGMPDLLDAMRPGAPEPDPMGDCVGADWLVLDDMGVDRPSDWVRERLYVLVNGRYEAEKQTIVTSNCDLGTLADAIGERTVSRLAESVTIVMLDGDDLRRR